MLKVIHGMVLLLIALCQQANSAYSQSDQNLGWLHYNDNTSGLSFRYPPSMQVREDTKDFLASNPFGHIQKIVILETKELVVPSVGGPGHTVLVFFVKENRIFPDRPWVETFETEQKGCRRWRSHIINGHRALECISCGSAACDLSIELFDPHRCTIHVDALQEGIFGGNGDFLNQKLYDASLPVPSIIDSIHFASAK